VNELRRSGDLFPDLGRSEGGLEQMIGGVKPAERSFSSPSSGICEEFAFRGYILSA